MANCLLSIFSKLTVDQLKAFIAARQYPDKERYVTPPGNKGTLKEAQEGIMKMILFAYNWRQRSITIIEHQDQDEPTDINDSDVGTIQTDRVHNNELASSEVTVLPSDLLSNEEWVRNTTNLMSLVPMSSVISTEDKDKANKLAQHLTARFREHKSQKVLAARRNHWSMKFASKNLAVNAALMVLSNHVKKDIARLSEEDSLLSGDISKFQECSLVPEQHGAYLYYDKNNEVFIRSGKVTNRGFKVRDDEHRLAAKSMTSKSRFYALYPSTSSQRANIRGTRGVFENLVQLVGSSFKPLSPDAMNLNRDWKDGGLLILSDKEKECISESSAGKTQIQKFHNICAYQLELSYDLAISPLNNVSQNPGFESFLGIVNGYDKRTT